MADSTNTRSSDAPQGETHTSAEERHEWGHFVTIGSVEMNCCKKCGVILQSSGRNVYWRCRGPVTVGPRQEHTPLSILGLPETINPDGRGE